jgi:hypothetical protein
MLQMAKLCGPELLGQFQLESVFSMSRGGGDSERDQAVWSHHPSRPNRGLEASALGAFVLHHFGVIRNTCSSLLRPARRRTIQLGLRGGSARGRISVQFRRPGVLNIQRSLGTWRGTLRVRRGFVNCQAVSRSRSFGGCRLVVRPVAAIVSISLTRLDDQYRP